MFYSLRGMVFAMVGVALLGGYAVLDRGINFKPARATVSYIDRNCDIVTTTYDADYKPTFKTVSRDSCNSIEEVGKG